MTRAVQPEGDRPHTLTTTINGATMRSLDTDHHTHRNDKGPHYETFDATVRVTLDRAARRFHRYTPQDEALQMVLTDALASHNETHEVSHSVELRVTPSRTEYSDENVNEWRADLGDSILDTMCAMLGTDDESVFTDTVSYLLHAEMRRRSQHDGQPWKFSDCQGLLDAAYRSFDGDGEDGPYSFNPELGYQWPDDDEPTE